MKIQLVGDGPRDQYALERLVASILEIPIQATFKSWKEIRLNRYNWGTGSILKKRLIFALHTAADENLGSLVAVVDTDKKNPLEQLRELRAAREQCQRKGLYLPTALGEANPHFDIWLLDDRKAIVEAWKVEDSEIPDCTKSECPKEELDRLFESSQIGINDIAQALSLIAENVVISRCIHAEQTGFADFVGEINSLV